MYGPVSDLVPSSPIFEMYPLGFTTIAEYLERHGHHVRIINIALSMLKKPGFDVEKYIQSLRPRVFGIDLHWLPHAHGSVELAKICKKYHPDIPIIFGGFSATYFHDELIRYPCVDFVMKGDSTEEPLLQLMDCIKSKRLPWDVPNLTWKDQGGRVHNHPITYVPENFDHFVLNYTHVMRSVVKYKDLMGYVPFESWLNYPIVPVLTCRGCAGNCLTCGGSRGGFSSFMNRKKPAFRSPEVLADDIKTIQHYLRAPIFVIGDIHQAGPSYVDRFLRAIKERNITNQVAFEFFVPPPAEFYRRVSEILPHYSCEISMESHDEEVRSAFGKKYTNEQVEESIRAALNHNCERFDLYFMTGLPRQTSASVLETVDYCENLYRKVEGDKRLLVFISPMAPFLDPGSVIFENPEKYGYRLLCKTLEDHREALTQPSWKYVLNYETRWMTRDELVESTYEAGLRLNRLKASYGVVDQQTATATEHRITRAMQIMDDIDEIMKVESLLERDRRMRELKSEVDRLCESTVCEKSELEWPTVPVNVNLFNVTRFLLSRSSIRHVRLSGILSLLAQYTVIFCRKLLEVSLEGRRA
jgi:B12-binding domain/radical SAM domain protein